MIREVQEGDRITVTWQPGVVFWVKPVFSDGVVAVMVGDDREHVVDDQDYETLHPDEHVCSCGQVGCGHDA